MSGGGRKETRSQQVRREDIPLPSTTTTNTKFAFQQSSRQSALLARRASIKLDVASFAAETYLPEYYLRGALEADTEEAIQAALRSLAAARDKAETELKRAVYKNHVEFVQISKEIMDFEGVLSELARIQVSLRNNATALVTSAGVANIISLDESATTQANEPGQLGNGPKKVIGGLSTKVSTTEQEAPRPTIDWEARHAKMESLTETIADFEKYLSPDRYLIFEGGGISEQASGMGLSAKSITLYLFNDAIAMASKKTRMVLAGSSRRLVLERFWPLSELLITDVPDTKSLTNAFKVARSGENVLLQAETATGKRLWLQQIIKTQKALEGSAGEGGSRERNPLVSRTASPMPLLPPTSPKGAGETSISGGVSSGAGVSGKIHKRTKSKGASGSEPTITAAFSGGGAALSPEAMDKLSLLTSQLDTLNAEVDRCNYEAAAELVDKVKFELDQMDGRVSLVHRLGERLSTLVNKLAAYLYHEITDLIISKENMAKYIQLLVVLGFPDEAREKFLAARSDFIRERTK